MNHFRPDSPQAPENFYLPGGVMAPPEARQERPLPPPFSSARLKFFAAMVACMLALLAARLVWITFNGHAPLPEKHLPDEASPQRGELTDRHGTLLAINLPTMAVYAHPLLIPDKETAVRELSSALPMVPTQKIRKALCSHKTFTWVARSVPLSSRTDIQSLGLTGVGIHKSYKRLYPYDYLFSHIIGMTDVDQKGVAGLEKSLERLLVRNTQPVRLSLDTRIQYVVHRALSQTIEAFHAVGGNGVVVHIPSGEILAMVSLPDFSPQKVADASPQALFNRNISGVYEFGSIFKIYNTALFLENTKKGLETIFDASQPLTIGRHVIRDFKGKGTPLSVREAFIFSSDIAHARMALAVGGNAQVDFFKKLGFDDPLRTELPEYAGTIFPKNTSLLQTAVRSFGYGIAVTPLHIVQAMRKLLGYTSPLTFLHRETPPAQVGEKPVSSATSLCIIKILSDAVTQGRVQNAAASNCRVGAKTGTANVLSGKRYLKDAGCNFTSCISVFPIDNPQYIVLVSVDRARGNASTHGYSTAGWIAAPLAARIVEEAVPLLGMLSPPLLAPEDIESEIEKALVTKNGKKP